MSSEKFITNKTALVTLIAACLVVLLSLGVRQVFGMFFQDLGKIISIAKKNKILTAIDNTWATPYFFKPI